jgi:hypothetical protein
MMWNTRYGMMTGGGMGGGTIGGGGMMGGGRSFASAGAMQVTSQQAQDTARRSLDASQPGYTGADATAASSRRGTWARQGPA